MSASTSFRAPRVEDARSLWSRTLLRYRVLTGGYMETKSENACLDLFLASIVVGLVLSAVLILKATVWQLLK